MKKTYKQKYTKLNYKSINLRKNIIDVISKSKKGHLGSAFSCLEIISVIYDFFIDKSSKNEFILSKGHGCLGLYSVLYDKGIIDKKTLLSFCNFSSLLGGHPEHTIPSVSFSTGSLGHGFSAGIGMSIANRIKKNKNKIFVLLGDGEINEGSVWEAFLSLKKHNLSNMITLIDYNKMQSYGHIKNILELEPLRKKMESFGFKVFEINGHSRNEIHSSLKKSLEFKTKPVVIICHTIKGKGIPIMENNPSWHYKSKIKDDELIKLQNYFKK